MPVKERVITVKSYNPFFRNHRLSCKETDYFAPDYIELKKYAKIW